MTMLRVGGPSDVLTPMSDCKQESVEKMDRRILGLSYMCGMGLHNGILCCGFWCARIVSLYFSTLFLPLSCVYSGSLLRPPRQGLPRPIYIARAITPSPLHGYHACVFTSRLPRHSSEFHFWVITPELSRSTTHINRVITPALVSTVVRSLPITGYYATFLLHLHHHRGATRTNLLHMGPGLFCCVFVFGNLAFHLLRLNEL